MYEDYSNDENPFKRGKTPRNDPVFAPEFSVLNKTDKNTSSIITRSRSPSLTYTCDWEKEKKHRKFYVFERVDIYYQTLGKTVSICDGYVYSDKEIYIIHTNDEDNNIITFRSVRNNTFFHMTLAEYQKIEVNGRRFITCVTSGIDVFGANFYYPNYDELLKPFF